MGVVDRLETLCDADRQDQARALATGVVQNDSVIDVEVSGAAPVAEGATVIHIETDHFHGRHVLSDRAAQGTGWPGRYTIPGADTADGFVFRTATMPADAERLVEARDGVSHRRTPRPENGHSESTDEASAGD